jgi:pimeloyl-ACP methyl ester carboxylesterase
MSHGGPLAIAYAALHPERVNHLILFGTHARGRLMRDPSPSAREQAQLMVSLIRMGWGQDQPAFRRLFTTLFIPGATAEQMQWFDELQRVTTGPETAVRLRQARNRDDVTREATQVTSRALVLHAQDDAVVPFAESRLLATLIPGARFVPLESQNHILLAGEPAWPVFLAKRFGAGKLEGWSAMQFIETSSITIHADELSNRCFIDVFSCRPFNTEAAAATAAAHFHGRSTLTVLQR